MSTGIRKGAINILWGSAQYIALTKDGSVVYPDFTIMKADGSLSYYEHFGMMDSSEYFDKFMSKIMQYERNGIVPNRNLFMTFETLECPLSIEDIQWVISKF